MDEEYTGIRSHINESIREYCRRAADSNRVYCVDMEKLMPYFDVNTAMKDTIHWDDGLHMTPIGYDKFGEFVFNAISSIVDNF